MYKRSNGSHLTFESCLYVCLKEMNLKIIEPEGWGEKNFMSKNMTRIKGWAEPGTWGFTTCKSMKSE